MHEIEFYLSVHMCVGLNGKQNILIKKKIICLVYKLRMPSKLNAACYVYIYFFFFRKIREKQKNVIFLQQRVQKFKIKFFLFVRLWVFEFFFYTRY